MRPRTLSILLVFLALGACKNKKDADSPKNDVATSGGEEPREKSTANTATIDIVSTPSREVIVDGKKVGKTPVTVDRLPAGMHEVTYVDDVNGNVTMTVELGEGEYKTVSKNFDPTAADAKPVK